MGAFDDLIPEQQKPAGAFDDLVPPALPPNRSLGRDLEDLGRLVLQGMTFGAGDELMAAVHTPAEMYRKGTFNPAEGYSSAKEWEDNRLKQARENFGGLSMVPEALGSVGTGAGLAKAGLTLVKKGAGFIPRMLGMAGEGAIYGGATGFNEGGDLTDRAEKAAQGAGMGAVIGAAIPAVTGAVGTVASPILSNIRARINPQGVAASQVARAVDESGKPLADIAADVRQAAAEGQPMYTVADAIGFPGQRLLRTGVSSQGPGRAEAVEFLEQRQAGQGRRVAGILNEGFGNPPTAAQAEGAIVAQARAANAPLYNAAYQAGDRPIWSPTLERLSASPSVLSAARSAERKWADWQVIDGYGAMNPPIRVQNGGILRTGGGGLETFPNIQYWDYVARDLAGKAQAARSAGNRQEAMRFGELERMIKTELDRLVPEFNAARASARGYFGQENAVEAGRVAATRGRTEDTIPAFRAMNPAEQQGFRAGYVDPLIAQVQGGAQGTNKARPFTSDAFKTESQAMAPQVSGNQMNRAIEREQTMFGTRAEATGGSKTDMNLADQGSQKVDVGLITSILGGDIAGIGQKVLARATNVLNGYTPEVRERIVKLLLERGNNPKTEAALIKEIERIARNGEVSRSLLRAATVGGAVSAGK